MAIEAGAGAQAAFPDADFVAAGAEIAGDDAAALAGAGIVFAVQPHHSQAEPVVTIIVAPPPSGELN